jgi:hypothetical protein
LKSKNKVAKQSKLTKADLATIAHIIGDSSSQSTTVKKDGMWRSANLFEAANEGCRIYSPCWQT